MKSPCETCLVQTSCTQVCDDQVVFIYENKDFGKMGDRVFDTIIRMTRPEALLFIKNAENAYRSVRFN